MAQLLWLPEVLRGAGLTVHEYYGWTGRGADSFGPVEGIVCHHTGSSLKATDAGDLRQLAITGTPSAPTVPISQLYLSRTGAWWVIASGTATGVKTGTGGPLKGRGDDAVLQIEAQHSGAGEAWTPVQYRSYVVGVAALAAKLGIEVRMVIGHKEHQPGDKPDPSFDMDQFRRDVAALMGGDHNMWCKHADSGENVLALQGDLEEAGGNLTPHGGVDGRYGNGTAIVMIAVLGAAVAGDGKTYGAKQRRALQRKLRTATAGKPGPTGLTGPVGPVGPAGPPGRDAATPTQFTIPGPIVATVTAVTP